MKLSSKIIAKILTLCGISLACTACYAPGYTDYADLTVRGIVTDEASGDPVEGIKVGLNWRETTTDAEGVYRISVEILGAPGEYPVEITLDDIDGEQKGGLFGSVTEQIELSVSDFVGGGRLNKRETYFGAAEKTADFTLTQIEKSDENE